MLQRLYQQFDHIKSPSFTWDDVAYKSHIESVCMALGEYEGSKHLMSRCEEGWIIETTVGDFDCRYYKFLSNAIEDFIIKEPRPELT